MATRLLSEVEYAEIRMGNLLIVGCQGDHSCGGRIRIPFRPGIDGAPDGIASKMDGCVWERHSGETLANISLSPSIQAGGCGHFKIADGVISDE